MPGNQPPTGSVGVLFAVLLVAAAGFLHVTTDALPERVASHFGSSGLPEAFMPRDLYRVYILAFGLGFPLLLTALIAWLARRFPHLTNAPHRYYWLAPKRPDETFDIYARHALAAGCMLVVFACAVHWLIVKANRADPPRLATGPLLTLLAAFLLAMGLWYVSLIRRLRRPGR